LNHFKLSQSVIIRLPNHYQIGNHHPVIFSAIVKAGRAIEAMMTVSRRQILGHWAEKL